MPIYPELFPLSRRDSVSNQRVQNITAELHLRKSYFEEINNSWHREYLHQVHGAKGEIWSSSPNPAELGEIAQLVTATSGCAESLELSINCIAVVMEIVMRLVCAYSVDFCDDPPRGCIN